MVKILQELIYFLWSSGIWPLTSETFEHHVLNGNLFTDIELVVNPVHNWTQRNNEGQVTVPWTVDGFSPKNMNELLLGMSWMEDQIGCMKFPHIPRKNLKETQWKHGVIFVWNNYRVCSSAVGQKSEWSAYKPNWQVINLGSCTDVGSAAQHELMHALGFPHEHQRPDRDEFIDVDYLGLVDILLNPKLSQKTKQQFLIDNARIDHFKWSKGVSNDDYVNYWKKSPFKFDLGSVMLYSSKAIVNNEGKPMMTLKNGNLFHESDWMSTTDVLKIQHLYCNADYSSNKLTHCGNEDELGMNRPLIVNRIGDSYTDCPNRVDELRLTREKHLQSFKIDRIYENVKTRSRLFQTYKVLFIGLLLSAIMFIPYKICIAYKRYRASAEDKLFDYQHLNKNEHDSEEVDVLFEVSTQPDTIY